MSAQKGLGGRVYLFGFDLVEVLPINKISPDETEHDGAGEEEVEDGDLKFSNVEWEDGVAGISGPK